MVESWRHQGASLFGAKLYSYCINRLCMDECRFRCQTELENASSRFQSVDKPGNSISITQLPNRVIDSEKRSDDS